MDPLLDRPIVLATANPKKIRELRAIFAEVGLEIESLADLGIETTEPDEIGTTFLENATIKALGYAEQTGRVCLADDSGLVVDALGGAPGVISSHYCTDGIEQGMSRDERDQANNEKLMRELEGVELAERSARFECVMVLAEPFIPQPPSGGGVQPPIPLPRGGGVPPPKAFIKRKSGNLPHWRLSDSTYLVTFRLLSGELNQHERQIVSDACMFQHPDKAVVHIATVMPDHVHMLVRPVNGADLSHVLHSIKSFTSHQINAVRGTTGRLWQRESYDRIMRSEDEATEAIAYIEMNPVRAGLVVRPGQYRWTVRGDGRRDAAPTGRGVVAQSRGTFEGIIGLPGDVPRGGQGFGYDPLFLVAPEHTTSSAELAPELKNSLSHRGQAARAMAKMIVAMR